MTLWRSSRWLGNGFGNQIRYVAVSPGGYVIGRYSSERHRTNAWVLDDPDLSPERQGSPERRSTVTTRLVKWRRAVKGLSREQLP
ncbi:hypothetical protein ACI8AV_17885 [Geodermatophilus sp. SYSU D00804]